MPEIALELGHVVWHLLSDHTERARDQHVYALPRVCSGPRRVTRRSAQLLRGRRLSARPVCAARASYALPTHRSAEEYFAMLSLLRVEPSADEQPAAAETAGLLRLPLRWRTPRARASPQPRPRRGGRIETHARSVAASRSTTESTSLSRGDRAGGRLGGAPSGSWSRRSSGSRCCRALYAAPPGWANCLTYHTFSLPSPPLELYAAHRAASHPPTAASLRDSHPHLPQCASMFCSAKR